MIIRNDDFIACAFREKLAKKVLSPFKEFVSYAKRQNGEKPIDDQ
jgi:hypothetical protein